MTKINGKVYDWSSVTIDTEGMEAIEPTEISYGDDCEKAFIFGKKGQIVGYGTGNKKNSVKISLHREDFDEMCSVIKAKGIKRFYDHVIPKITVSYADPGKEISVDILTNVSWTKRDLKASQGDTSMKVDIDGTATGGINMNGLEA